MSPTKEELKSAKEQGKHRKEMQKTEAVAKFEEVEEFLKHHLQVGMVFQKETDSDTIVIAHINWEAPIRSTVPGNSDDPVFPPDFPSIPPDPKKRGQLWDPKTKMIKIGGFKSAYEMQSHQFDEINSVHHVVWVRHEDEFVQFQTRKRGFKSPNVKSVKVSLAEFLSMIKGWQVIDQE